MSETVHSWCRDTARDEAIRAAEDDAANWRRLEVGEVIEAGDEFQKEGNWVPVQPQWFGEAVTVYHLPHRRRRVPPPDHRDLPSAVNELRRRLEGLEAVADAWRRQCEADADAENREAAVVSRDGVTFTENGVFREAKTPSGAVNHAADVSCGEADGLRDVRDSRNAKANGLRTERVTLEVTHCSTKSIRDLAGRDVRGWLEAFSESVRVVDDRTGTDMGNGVFVASTEEVLAMCRETEARLTAERDAALRERDAARADAEHDVREVLAFARLERDAAKEEAEKATSLAKGLEEKRAYFRRERDVARDECERLRIRVAELESAPAANAGGEQPQPPRGWLTAEERRTLGIVVTALRAAEVVARSDASRSVLTKQANDVDTIFARSTPPRVKAPSKAFIILNGESMVDVRDNAWIAAIRDAGVEVSQ